MLLTKDSRPGGSRRNYVTESMFADSLSIQVLSNFLFGRLELGRCVVRCRDGKFNRGLDFLFIMVQRFVSRPAYSGERCVNLRYSFKS